jgi:hypothetical protein
MEDHIIVRKDAPFLVRMEPSLRQRLLDKADCEGMSAAALVRSAVRHYLDPDAKCKPRKRQK